MPRDFSDPLRSFYDDDIIARTRAEAFAEGYRARAQEEIERLEGAAYPSLSGIEASSYDYFSLN